tara:strand:- start:654 stop:851 length:198 start_codon:yes stop_codon:yes gene_type:complete
MIALRDTQTTWLAYTLEVGLLAAIAYGGMQALALDTDDFEYLMRPPSAKTWHCSFPPIVNCPAGP